MNAPAPKPQYLDPVREAQAVEAIRQALAAVGAADDEELLTDSIEGETSLFEAIDKLLERRALNVALAEGADAAIARLEARKLRFEQLAEQDRAAIEQALAIAGLKTLQRPAGTLTLANRPPSLIVTEESEIPAKYWKAGKPSLDRKALTADLKEQAQALAAVADDPEKRAALAASLNTIPGVTLSNGAPSLTIRTA